MYKFIWLVPLLQLVGAAIHGIFGRRFRFPEKLIGGIAVGTVPLSFLIGGAVQQTLGYAAPGSSTTISVANQPVTVSNPRSSLLNIEWSYQLDPLSAVFMLIVTGVGLCIFVFATGYMHGD